MSAWKEREMPEYEEWGSLNASPDAAFGYLSDVGNLPKYVSGMILAQLEQDDHLRVAAEVQGRHEEGQAWFRVDPEGRRIEWGGQSRSGYSGWLEVSGSGPGCSVTIHLETDREEDAEDIRRALAQTMANITSQVEGL